MLLVVVLELTTLVEVAVVILMLVTLLEVVDLDLMTTMVKMVVEQVTRMETLDAVAMVEVVEELT